MRICLKKSGFTLIEMILVIAIFSLVVGVTLPLYGNLYLDNKLKNARVEMIDTLKRAQVRAMTGKENDNWGVHFQSDKFVFFKGSSYSAGAPTNIEHDLEDAISITSISLQGGGGNIIFDKMRGTTSQYGAVTLSNSATSDTAVVSVSQVGLISY